MRVDGRELDPMEIEDALEALIKAEEIKKHPELMKACVEMAGKRKDAICSIADLKKAYSKAVEDDKDEEEEDAMPKKMGMKKNMSDMMEDSPQDKEIEKRVKNNE